MTKLIYNDNGILDRLETWGGSTKHPDAVFYYKDFDKPYEDDNSAWCIYQFIINCAAQMSFVPHTVGMVRFAQKYIINYIMEADKCTEEEAEHALAVLG